MLSTIERTQPTLAGSRGADHSSSRRLRRGCRARPTVPPTPASDLRSRPEQRDAPMCYQCGNTMQRAGSCYVCGSCGTTSGCS